MLFRDVINLVTVTATQNDMGDSIETLVESDDIFANKKSIRQSEFYQSAMTDFKPEIMFEIRQIEYNDESKLKYDNKTYDIIRTYSKNGEIIELVCSRLVSV